MVNIDVTALLKEAERTLPPDVVAKAVRTVVSSSINSMIRRYNASMKNEDAGITKRLPRS